MTTLRTLAIVGASAGVGRLAVQLALARGHRVRALARRVEGLPQHPNLQAVTGSATDAATLRRAIEGADAVLVTLGTGMDRKPTTLYTDFARALLPLQPLLGETPVQLLTGFGAGDSAAYQGPVARLLFRLLLRAVYENKTAMERMIERSGLNWSFVRPGMLTNGATDAAPKVQANYRPGMKVGAVSRAAVARFMVDQAEAPAYSRAKPALSAGS